MNDMPDSDTDELIRGLWNRHRARLPRFDPAHRETVLAAVADMVAVAPAPRARRPAGLLAAAVAAAIVVALPSWLAVLSLPSPSRAVTAVPAAVSLGARAEAVGIALPAAGSTRLAAVARSPAPDGTRPAPHRAVLRSIDVHTLLDAPTFTPGETF
jgi:hypothetical protein